MLGLHISTTSMHKAANMWLYAGKRKFQESKGVSGLSAAYRWMKISLQSSWFNSPFIVYYSHFFYSWSKTLGLKGYISIYMYIIFRKNKYHMSNMKAEAKQVDLCSNKFYWDRGANVKRKERKKIWFIMSCTTAKVSYW